MIYRSRLAILSTFAACAPMVAQSGFETPDREIATSGEDVSTLTPHADAPSALCTSETLSTGLESAGAHIVESVSFSTREGQVTGYVVARSAEADRVTLEVYLRTCTDGVARAFGGLQFGSMPADSDDTDDLDVDAVDFFGEGQQALQIRWKDRGEDTDGDFERVDSRWFRVRAGQTTMVGSCIETWLSGGDGHRGVWNLLTPGEPPTLEGVREFDGAQERFGGQLLPVLEGDGRDDLCSRADAVVVERIR